MSGVQRDWLQTFPVPGTREWNEMIFDNQTVILEWLKSRGHEIEDALHN